MLVRQLLLFLAATAWRVPTISKSPSCSFFCSRFSRGKCSTACAMTSRCGRWPTRFSACSMSFGFTISSPKLSTSRRVRRPARSPASFTVLYLIAVTKFSDMGAYLTGSLIGRHQLIPHISPKKTWEGFFGALAFSLFASVGLFRLMPGHLSMLNLTHADRARIAPRFRRGHWRFGGIDHQAQHRRERFGQHVAGNWRRARSDRQPALHRAAAVFLSAACRSVH